MNGHLLNLKDSFKIIIFNKYGLIFSDTPISE